MWQKNVKCDVRTVQLRMKPTNVKEIKKKKPPNVTNVLSNVTLQLHNVRIKSSNVRKIKETTKCDKRTITYDIGTTQCDDETIKSGVMITWYSKLPTSGYHTQKKKEYSRSVYSLTFFLNV